MCLKRSRIRIFSLTFRTSTVNTNFSSKLNSRTQRDTWMNSHMQILTLYKQSSCTTHLYLMPFYFNKACISKYNQKLYGGYGVKQEISMNFYYLHYNLRGRNLVHNMTLMTLQCFLVFPVVNLASPWNIWTVKITTLVPFMIKPWLPKCNVILNSQMYHVENLNKMGNSCS